MELEKYVFFAGIWLRVNDFLGKRNQAEDAEDQYREIFPGFPAGMDHHQLARNSVFCSRLSSASAEEIISG